MELIGCAETSVTDYQPALRNIPEGRRPTPQRKVVICVKAIYLRITARILSDDAVSGFIKKVRRLTIVLMQVLSSASRMRVKMKNSW